MAWPQSKNIGRTPNDRPMECPSCQGRGESFQFVDYAGGGGSSGYFPCSTCAGTGSITFERSHWMSVGQVMRDERRRYQISQRAAADALGVSPSVLSQAEHGVIDPTDLFARVCVYDSPYKALR